MNRDSFDRSYRTYLTERSSYLELFQRFEQNLIFDEHIRLFDFRLPQGIAILHQLKLPQKLLSSIDTSSGIYQKSTVSSSTSSSSISIDATTSANYSPPINENDIQNPGEMSLLEWITAQVCSLIAQHFFHFSFLLVGKYENR